MKAQSVYELMKKIKKAPPEVEANGKRLLNYIYGDVYERLLELKKKLGANYQEGTYGYKSDIKPYTLLKPELENFIVGYESIITYFTEMIEDNYPEFIDAFFERVSIFFDMSEGHYYDENDFTSLAFIFNIYAMLKGYHEHKDDLAVFNTILDDCSFLVDSQYLLSNPSWAANHLKGKKEYIDMLLETRFFGEVLQIRDLFKETLKNMVHDSEFSEKDIEKKSKFIEGIGYIYNDLESLKGENPNYLLVDFDSMFKVVKNHFNNSDANESIYYCKTLLIDERFAYMNESLDKHIHNRDIKYSIYKYIKDFDRGMFDYLNNSSNNGKDSFIEIMKMVFDSDTYHELEAKLEVIVKASNDYTAGNKDGVLNIYNNLSDPSLKKMIEDNVLIYGDNSLNKTDKPDLISERMRKIYEKFYPRISFGNCMKFAKVYSDNLCDFNKQFDKVISRGITELRTKEKEEQERLAKLKVELLAFEGNSRNDAEGPSSSEPNEVWLISEDGSITNSPSEVEPLAPPKDDNDDKNQGIFKIKSIFGKKE